jgi:hypothetical protein
VLDDDHRDAELAIDRQQELPQPVCFFHRDACDRLVEQDDARPRDDRARNLEAALSPATNRLPRARAEADLPARKRRPRSASAVGPDSGRVLRAS